MVTDFCVYRNLSKISLSQIAKNNEKLEIKLGFKIIFTKLEVNTVQLYIYTYHGVATCTCAESAVHRMYSTWLSFLQRRLESYYRRTIQPSCRQIQHVRQVSWLLLTSVLQVDSILLPSCVVGEPGHQRCVLSFGLPLVHYLALRDAAIRGF